MKDESVENMADSCLSSESVDTEPWVEGRLRPDLVFVEEVASMG